MFAFMKQVVIGDIFFLYDYNSLTSVVLKSRIWASCLFLFFLLLRFSIFKHILFLFSHILKSAIKDNQRPCSQTLHIPHATIYQIQLLKDALESKGYSNYEAHSIVPAFLHLSRPKYFLILNKNSSALMTHMYNVFKHEPKHGKQTFQVK